MSSDWRIFLGNQEKPHDGITGLPPAPPWRTFHGEIVEERKLPSDLIGGVPQGKSPGARFKAHPDVIRMVNAALYLRRPLLVSGMPGTGKSSLIEAVAWELRLGEVLRWPITSRSTLRQGLYEYDALGRLQEQQRSSEVKEIGDYIELGPLGTALLPTSRPRALLIDEIDKSDIDLPNDLLNAFEEGQFHIPELARLKGGPTVRVREYKGQQTFPVRNGQVECHQFPFVILTSNGEREFPAPFLRRCVRVSMPTPTERALAEIVTAHLGSEAATKEAARIKAFAEAISKKSAVATDQLLNSIFLLLPEMKMGESDRELVLTAIQKELADPERA
jgi:MoxR-like ATPase